MPSSHLSSSAAANHAAAEASSPGNMEWQGTDSQQQPDGPESAGHSSAAEPQIVAGSSAMEDFLAEAATAGELGFKATSALLASTAMRVITRCSSSLATLPTSSRTLLYFAIQGLVVFQCWLQNSNTKAALWLPLLHLQGLKMSQQQHMMRMVKPLMGMAILATRMKGLQQVQETRAVTDGSH